MIIIQIGDLNIDNTCANVKPNHVKVNHQFKRALSGKAKQSWNSIKREYSIEFTSLTKSERDSVYNKWSSLSNFTFVDHENVSVPNCMITDPEFPQELSWTNSGTLLYSFSISIKEQ